MFQSQAGFVPLCDEPLVEAIKDEFGVSIPGGICSSLRQQDLDEGVILWCVSIPGGICSSLRRAHCGLH